MSTSKSPRPLSGGVWSLLSWLRGDERGSSSDSLSSGASARTAASFSFLRPTGYPGAAPTLCLPPHSPTNSYKKRVRDRDIRRQYERDLTLHRKYLLPLGETRYTSLPPARRSGENRERRATSESLRRAAYVPGKRRAPAPPRASTLRRRTDKRPAPQPPLLSGVVESKTNNMSKQEESILKKEQKIRETKQGVCSAADVTLEQVVSRNKINIKEIKSEIKSPVCQAEMCGKKDVKIRQDKSFLKQIFESRSKRNSSIDVLPVKLLPSISELDKQAAELLESYKLKAFEQNNNVSAKINRNKKHSGQKWFCTRCLKKYDATMVTCLDCLSEAKVSSDSNKYRDSCLALKHSETQTYSSNASTSNNLQEKQKLKEMLKEMKDSLPKNSKPGKNGVTKKNYFFNTEDIDDTHNYAKETPTLPIGSSLQKNIAIKSLIQQNQSMTAAAVQLKEKLQSSPLEVPAPIETVVTTTTTVLMNSPFKENVINNQNYNYCNQNNINSSKNNDEETKQKNNLAKDIVQTENNIVQPQKISTLLNPVYIPKNIEKAEHKSPSMNAKETFLLQNTTNLIKDENIKQITISESQQTVLEKTFKEGANIHVSGSPMIAATSPLKSCFTSSEHQTFKKSYTKEDKKHEIKSPSPKKETEKSNDSTSNTSISLNKTVNNAVNKTTKDNAVASTSRIINPEPTINLRSSSDQHSKRRDLINQLEKSIAKGDEQAAAEAAIKLAQLRLSCSVLSFSSQIIAEAISPIEVEPKTNNIIAEPSLVKESLNSSKVNSATQSEGEKCLKVLNKSEKETHRKYSNKYKINIVGNVSAKEQCDIAMETKTHNNEMLESNIIETAPKSTLKATEDNNTIVEVWIEDREAARGPVRLMVPRGASLGALRRVAEARLGLPQRLQRWIIGKTLCTLDNTPLANLAGPALDAPFYLCVVESETTKQASAEILTIAAESNVTTSPNSMGSSTTSTIAACLSSTTPKIATGSGGTTSTNASLMNVTSTVVAGSNATTTTIEVGSSATKTTIPTVSSATTSTTASVSSVTNSTIVAELNATSHNAVETTVTERTTNSQQTGKVYAELMELERQALVPNQEAFECEVCLERCERAAGVVVRECLHEFCRACLAGVVRHSAEAAVACPARGCAAALQEREARALSGPADHERRLARGLAAAARAAAWRAVYCRARACDGWALPDPDAAVATFRCPLCQALNCLPCQDIHEGETCEEHRNRLQQMASADQSDAGTQALLQAMIARGEALECPECRAVITKKWGCDWVRCSACKTEICWVTRGRRWGPAGKGDVSAGCRCGLDGKRCHPSCGYCH